MEPTAHTGTHKPPVDFGHRGERARRLRVQVASTNGPQRLHPPCGRLAEKRGVRGARDVGMNTRALLPARSPDGAQKKMTIAVRLSVEPRRTASSTKHFAASFSLICPRGGYGRVRTLP